MATTAIATVVAAVAVAVAGGCTSETPSTTMGPWANRDSTASAAAPGGDAGEAGDGTDEMVDRTGRRTSFTLLRGFDPCGYLDVGVIAAVTGMTPGTVVPGGELSECSVKTQLDRIRPGWMFRVRVGVVVPDDYQADARTETVDDQELLVVGDKHGCAHTRLIGDQIGIRLVVGAPPVPMDQEPCEVATAYLTDALETFTARHERATSATQPRIPLSDKDPCDTVDAVLAALGQQGSEDPLAPYACGIVPDDADKGAALKAVRISYLFNPDPRADTAMGDAAPPGQAVPPGVPSAITVAGHDGAVFDLPGEHAACGVSVVVHPEVTLQVSTMQMVPVVEVRASDCEAATSAAEAVLAELAL